MTPEDCALLHGLCFRTPRPWSEAEFASLLQDPLCFLLEEAEALLAGRAVAGDAELLTLAVAPQSRRRGQGRKLVARFIYQARLRGADRAFLEVAEDNQPAIRLYESAGFQTAGRRKAYYLQPDGRRIDAIVMTRAL